VRKHKHVAPIAPTVSVPSRRGKTALLCWFFAGCFALNAWLARPAIRSLAPTYDEPVQLAAGYVYLKTGDYRLNGLHHPPLAEMVSAFPLLYLNPPPLVPVGHPAWVSQTWSPSQQYSFADTFLYHNRVSADAMMAAARTMQWFLQCVLGVILIWTAWRLSGAWASALVAFAWSCSPALLAHGTQVTTDLAFATFYFAFFAALATAPKPWRGVLAGVALGLCFASKYFALALLPSLAVCAAWDAWVEKKKIDWITFGLMAPVALIVIAAVYRFQGLGLFWHGLVDLLYRAEAGRSSFFMGRHSNQGWLLYFPMALLVKTPVGQLVASVLGGALLLKKKQLPSTLWIPPLLFFAVSCLSNVQIGHRYILACYPFLIFAVGGLGAGSSTALVVGALLLVWQAVSTARVRPDYLSYFNELIGGPANGYRYFTDSNVDWGQSLAQLPAALTTAEKADGIYLSYFGTADPHAYGLLYLDVGSTGVIRHPDDTESDLSPTTFVISATNLQSTYYADKDLFSWLKEIPPRAVVGNSLFIYDLSKYPERLAFLRKLRS
jgi:hypothetical protein